LTPQGSDRLRQRALTNRPWEHSTGPKTAAGKARSAANGRSQQKGELSIRQIRSSVADIQAMLNEMAVLRRLATRGGPPS
jgi:hypothetical protein